MKNKDRVKIKEEEIIYREENLRIKDENNLNNEEIFLIKEEISKNKEEISKIKEGIKVIPDRTEIIEITKNQETRESKENNQEIIGDNILPMIEIVYQLIKNLKKIVSQVHHLKIKEI